MNNISSVTILLFGLSFGVFNVAIANDETITSKYVTTKDLMPPNLGLSVPIKGESRIDPITGVKITRLTDATALSGSDDALIVYSRYSPENTAGTYFLAFGDNSTSSWVINRQTGDIITELRHDPTHQIGEAHEVRWDLSGAHPNRVYFRTGMQFYMIDDVTDQDNTLHLIKDFSTLIPQATKIYNDVEGDSSNDSDHWAWMATHYDGTTYVVDAFVHYQISTDTIHILKPADLAGTNLDHRKNEASFPRPNMVEVSPLGIGIVLHYGRAWGDADYGSRHQDIDSWFDGAHLWPLDFNVTQHTPVKISVGETHSGWSFDQQGREVFISQNNRTDKLDAIHVSGDVAGYEHRQEIASYADFGWSNGFHYGKMSISKKGWAFVNTYSNVANDSHHEDWAADQLLMVQLKPEAEAPIIWRIGSNYNRYDGEYRDEAPAAINTQGNRIYLSNNWGGMLDHREVFLFELPDDWDQVLSNTPDISSVINIINMILHPDTMSLEGDCDGDNEVNINDVICQIDAILAL